MPKRGNRNKKWKYKGKVPAGIDMNSSKLLENEELRKWLINDDTVRRTLNQSIPEDLYPGVGMEDFCLRRLGPIDEDKKFLRNPFYLQNRPIIIFPKEKNKY